MANYCKITTDKRAMTMPNPYHLSVANPTEEQKVVIANFDNWLEMVNTPQPEYDLETQYVTDYWEEEEGKAVQHWEVHDKPIPEPTLEDRMDNAEQNINDNTDAILELGELV